MTARFALARAAGRTAAGLSRLTGRGGGTTIGGRVTLLVDPHALAAAARGRELALVSGTNGKSTTRTLLVAALATSERVVSNGGGANLPTGLTAALTADRTSRRGVLEVDEPYLPAVATAVKPRVVVLLNLTRDQLDRNAEVRRVAGLWHDALAAMPDVSVVANADDPLVAWAASASSNVLWVAAGQRWTYDSTSCPACGDILRRDDSGGWRSDGCGLTRPTPTWQVDDPLVAWAASASSNVMWVAAGQRWTYDSTSCPACGDILRRDGSGGWRSDGCGLTRPTPTWQVDDHTVTDPAGTRHDVQLTIPGQVNVGNAALAAAAASLWDVPPDRAFSAMASIGSVEGRYLETSYDGRPVRLLLAKNPAGWSEALRMARPDASLVIAVNARAADGRDPSWLWDVPFEVLRGRHAVASGERSRDVAVRLRYAGVEHVRVDDLASAMRAAGANGAASGPVEVLANYTAFQGYRKVVGDV